MEGVASNGASVPARIGGVPARRNDERKAVIRLGDEQVSVRLDADGFITRSLRRVKLRFGPELYAAKTNPGPTEKVMPYQPGYMRLVAAMGGQLVCPATVRDPETGNVRPNPLVETYEGTSIIRRVTATAICAVRNPATGEWCVSVQTNVQDAEGALRQALLKLERQDEVQTLSAEDIAILKGEGKFRGWVAIPLMPPYAYICCNMGQARVREAWQTFQNLALTIRQRACSKAERLAADHNPLTRMVWEYADLTFNRDKDGDLTEAPYMEVPVVAWVEHRGRPELEAWIRSLSEHGQADAVGEIIGGDAVVDVPHEEPEDLLDEETVPAALPPPVEPMPRVVPQTRTPEPVSARPAQSRAPAPMPGEERQATPEPVPERAAPTAPPVADEEINNLLDEVDQLAMQVSDPALLDKLAGGIERGARWADLGRLAQEAAAKGPRHPSRTIFVGRLRSVFLPALRNAASGKG